MQKTLVILAAGIGSRYGGLKQMDPVGPSGEFIIDYSVFDALRAGFTRVVFIIRHDIEEAFRATIGARVARHADVAYAFQELADLPAGFVLPADRRKPWGTGQALLSCRALVQTPMAVINADDFYGAEAYRSLAAHLDAAPAAGTDFAMVGYRLDGTLSPHGTVARGICRADAHGWLERIEETGELRAVAGGVASPRGVLAGTECVSMNFWGFTPAIFAELESRFPVFLRQGLSNPKSEFFVPTVVDELIRERRARVRVLSTTGSWLGVTNADDKAPVVAAIRALVDAGAYPARLWN